MELASYLVKAVLVEGRSPREVAAAHGVSKTWVYELLARYRRDGEAGLVSQSKRPKSSPTRMPDRLEDEIVTLRKALADEGFDAGAATIQYHLSKKHRSVPSVSSIWRVLVRRGFVTPEPHKRPKGSYIRFVAALPNECWQQDTTHVLLADGTDVEVLDVIDDHSRLCVAATARLITKAADVVATFHEAAAQYGYPASVLSDNGAIFTAESRHGVCVMESELLALGILYKHSRPYHPQTCGKVERFHQTLKKYLAKQPRPKSVAELQGQLDRFRSYYNEERPHRALGRRTPAQVFAARTKAVPSAPTLKVPPHCRVRQDKIDNHGRVTLRYRSRLYHVGLGRGRKGTRVLILVADLDVRVMTHDGELLRHLTLDPTRNYQPMGPSNGP
ncbi:MAG TPA: IS481 family transposase [Acidimicrobiales bacterium]|nr:IS481 family transposase [Acidimicrobiales bacterium]